MSNICSVLNNEHNINFVDIPYPHLIIDNALPIKYYEKLNQAFPSYDKIIKSDIINGGKYKDNFPYRYNASDSLNDREIPKIWREFVGFHTSFKFVEDFYSIFNSSINKLYPGSRGKLANESNTGIRFTGRHYFNLDCQFVINTPTKEETSVIDPHLDNPKEFYAALLYMRDPNDDSVGGNLTTYSFKGEPSFYGKSRVREEKINLVEEIEYKENRLVMFLNTLNSIHGVSKRSKTDYFRKYINIIGEFNFELFNFRKFIEK